MSQEVQSHVLAKYTLTKKLGSGAYGHVWKVTERKTGNILALKKIFDAFQHAIDAQRTYRQICYLHQMNHPNIIKMHHLIRADNDKDLYLIFEFMEADLHNAIGQKILKDIHNRFIMYQIFKGIKYIHSAEIIHRDLKPSNILINSDCHLKLCDFGLARSLAGDDREKDVVMTEQVATRWYRAPEVLLGSKTYDKAADIWSIGCIMAQLLIGKPIFPGNSTLNQLQKIISFTGKPKKQDIDSLETQVARTMIDSLPHIKSKPLREWFKTDIPADAMQLVRLMLQFNPTKRPTIQQLLKSSYISQFSNSKEEIQSKKIIKPSVSDSKKLNLKQYRQLIYQRIKKLYCQKQDNDPYVKKSPSSLHKSNYEYLRHSDLKPSYNSKIMRNTSSSKNPSTPTYSSSYSNLKTSNSLVDDSQKLKKKQSLKQILKNKRQKSVNTAFSSTKNQYKFQYSKNHYINSPLISKYKNGFPHQKQNRQYFSKFDK